MATTSIFTYIGAFANVQTMGKSKWLKGIPLESELQERLRALVQEKGETDTAEFLGIGESSVVRAAAGLGLRRGTAFIIRMKLLATETVERIDDIRERRSSTHQRRGA